MKLEDLKYYLYEKERLLKEIDTLNAKIDYGVSSFDYSKVRIKTISTDNATYNLVMQNIKIKKLLKKRYNEVVGIIEKMYVIINSIDDAELKQIVELRAIKGMTFEEIGEELHYDKSTISRKYQYFINKIEKTK